MALRSVFVAAVVTTSLPTAAQQLYVEYYRVNLFLGLAYHRVGCLTDWNAILSDRDYDGFSATRYCRTGASSSAVPSGEWFAWNFAESEDQLDRCGEQTNSRYGTHGYALESETCSYNVLLDCNSDCWIRAFSACQGERVPIISPCL